MKRWEVERQVGVRESSLRRGGEGLEIRRNDER